MGSRRDDLPAHRAPRSRARRGVPPKPLIGNSTKATPQEEEHPPPAVRPREEVQRVNQRCIEMLTQAARMARPEMSPLVTELREVLLQMTPERRVRAARRTFLLVDMELGNTDLWRRFKSHPARVEPALKGRGTFPRAAAVQLARDTLILAWYGVRADCHGARLLLGLSAAVSDIIASLSLTDINRIAERQFSLRTAPLGRSTRPLAQPTLGLSDPRHSTRAGYQFARVTVDCRRRRHSYKCSTSAFEPP